MRRFRLTGGELGNCSVGHLETHLQLWAQHAETSFGFAKSSIPRAILGASSEEIHSMGSSHICGNCLKTLQRVVYPVALTTLGIIYV